MGEERLWPVDGPAAAAAIFEGPGRRATKLEARRFFTWVCRYREPFSISEAWRAAPDVSYEMARRMLRALFLEGHLRRVSAESGPGSKPVIYEWVDD